MSRAETLHDVENVEAFCSRLLSAALDSNGGYLRPDQREEAQQYLVVTAYELGRGFRPGTVTFERYASFLLKRRLVDWYRQTLGDSRARRRPRSVPLDTFATEDVLPVALTVGSHEDEVLMRVAIH
jgi:hypothetical protein